MTARYDFIGTTYDATRRADPGIADRLVELLDASRGAPVLDVACGTANYTSALSDRGLVMVGVDLSWGMLAQARAKKVACPLVLADGAALPFADSSHAHAVTTLAIHHMADLERVFADVRRALAERGRYVIFSALPEQGEAYWLASYFPTMMAAARRVLPTRETVEHALSAAGFCLVGFETWDVPSDLSDLFLYAGKDRPELYFDPGYRNGISAFREHRGPEIEEGLVKLRADLDSGLWWEVRASADRGLGDYCFFVAQAT